MVLGNLALGGQGGRDRDVQLLDRGAQRIRGLRADHAAAGEQQRPLRLRDHVGDAPDGVLVGAHAVRARPRAAGASILPSTSASWMS